MQKRDPMNTDQVFETLDTLHHLAVVVPDIGEAVAWYTTTLRCQVRYQDDTWALLDFANVKLALVVPHQHPPHIAVATPNAGAHGVLQTHRDGTRSVYITAPFGQTVELLESDDSLRVSRHNVVEGM